MIKKIFPYLFLETIEKTRLIRRDIFPIIFIAVLLATPFVSFPSVNYFHQYGFIDRVGGFTAVLTGFYVAGLVAVSSMSHNAQELDKLMDIGKVYFRIDKDTAQLSRRQYVCFMFGYLAALSLFITVFSQIIVVITPALNKSLILHFRSGFGIDFFTPKNIMIFTFSLPVSSLGLITARGLHYLVDRMYFQGAKLK